MMSKYLQYCGFCSLFLLVGCNRIILQEQVISDDPSQASPKSTAVIEKTLNASIRSGFALQSFRSDVPENPLVAYSAVETSISIPVSGKNSDDLENVSTVIVPNKSQRQNNVVLAVADSTSVVRKTDNIQFCQKVDRRLHSVSFKKCLLPELKNSDFQSHHGDPIFYTDFATIDSKTPLGKVLLLGGVHGDELTSVSSVFSWIDILSNFHSGLFSWRIVPLVNPDGFFKSEPTRTNANGVDLNRNLPTDNWYSLANIYWVEKADSLPRKFPGTEPASEPETKWLIEEIERFKPDVIVSVHAPYNLVDFDARTRFDAPRKLGILEGKSLGTFPGSLGRYAGEQKDIPVITIELPHSTKMPNSAEIRSIWIDLVRWLKVNINNRKQSVQIQSTRINKVEETLG